MQLVIPIPAPQNLQNLLERIESKKKDFILVYSSLVSGHFVHTKKPAQ